VAASVSITDPANNGDPFPSVITGNYAGGAGDVVVEITNEATNQTTTHTATAAGGSWSLAKPAKLTPGATYTITALYSGKSDTKTGIQN
jgi:hypothetical protein